MGLGAWLVPSGTSQGVGVVVLPDGPDILDNPLGRKGPKGGQIGLQEILAAVLSCSSARP